MRPQSIASDKLAGSTLKKRPVLHAIFFIVFDFLSQPGGDFVFVKAAACANPASNLLHCPTAGAPEPDPTASILKIRARFVFKKYIPSISIISVLSFRIVSCCPFSPFLFFVKCTARSTPQTCCAAKSRKRSQRRCIHIRFDSFRDIL